MIDPHYSRALDEIYRMRTGLAFHVKKLREVLEYKTLPVRVRTSLEQQVRLFEMVLKESDASYFSVRPNSAARLLREAGAPETLTRSAWEESDGVAGR